MSSEAKGAQADLILCTGDLTQRATHSQFDAAAEYCAQFDAPVVLCAGNHDMAYYNLWERFTDPYRRFRNFYEGVSSDFTSEDCILVPLKTTVRAQPRFLWSDGYVREKALEETRRHLHSLAGDTRLLQRLLRQERTRSFRAMSTFPSISSVPVRAPRSG